VILRVKSSPLSITLCGVALLMCFAIFNVRLQRAHAQERPSYTPEGGFVPDEKTAIAIAEAVLVPVYGHKQITSEEPFLTSLNADTWSVHGSMPKGFNKGGVAEVDISKSKGCILRMAHGK
jgi:hypothetical protein